MRWWLVRDYEPFPEKVKPTDWDDVVKIQAGDEHEAAEQHARHQCARDPEYYSSYESGRFLEVKKCNAEDSTLVSVSVSLEPHFRSRIDRTITSTTELTLKTEGHQQ